MKGQEVAHVKTHRLQNARGRRNYVDSIAIEGLDELIRDFALLGEDAIYRLSDPSVKAAEVVLGRARSKIHDQTGELAANLKVTKPGGGGGKYGTHKAYRVFAKVGFGRGAQHGAPLELGHRLWFMGNKTNRDVAERPFLRPAADESKDDVANIMATAMNKILDEWGD